MIIAKDGIGLLSVSEQGSGVLISDKGEILTAAHLLQTADSVKVKFAEGAVVSALVVASEPAADVALLRLEQAPENVSVARLGNSDAVKVGDQVLVI